MTQPTPDVIEVAQADMYREADLWDTQAERLTDFAGQAKRLMITEYDVVLYNEFLTEYSRICQLYAQLCSEGVLVTREIGQTLRTVAQTFTEADDTLRAQYDHY